MNDDKKIKIPEKMQIRMIEFFLKTSIPRSLKEKNPLSKKKLDKEN